MLHKILLLIGILTFTGAKSQICESYEPNFSKFKVTDFGFHGKIKTISTSFLKKDETGEFKPSAWKTIQLHHNFDEKGNLISEYGIGHDLDTVEITYYSYNEKNKISEVKSYSVGFRGEFSTKDLRNWELKEAVFEYDENGNEIKLNKNQPYLNISTLKEFNSKNQLTKEVHLDNTSETNSSLNKSEYFYNEKGQLTKTICINEHNPLISGETLYTYENNNLVSEIFTRLDGMGGCSIYKKNGKVDAYYGKDTLTNYNKSIFNEKGELIRSFYHYDGDGEFKSNTKYSYEYDENKNLIGTITFLKSEIAHSRETNTEEYQKVVHEITYY